ncbi:MAG: hypothetical protein AAGB02_06915 [Pseudomonadota bacterium]
MISHIRNASIAAGLSLAGAMTTAQAEPLIRDAALFESFPIEGVSLSTLPEDAFNELIANGYGAGNVETYEQWGEGSLNLVRGAYGSPDGYSSVTIGRADGRLAFITQSLNKAGIDASAEIDAAQTHFGVDPDAPDCRMNAAGTSGACELRDAEAPDAVTMKFTMTAMATMILRSISRPKDLAKTLE